ncbi:hypothetical protein CUJ83_00765 [Methanocella sp. CWC-04]|uniref:HTH asnC-type domain-containing protein n=1 Tax=Methanooceanicella nereidis TaxID=2052831 RepID=A0AAP2RAM6_9EURY|nr:winged helix-turn-helix transcriptional regulator [Methanocella sp. CWC-04]MCD1293527.1 hypothetical protein [Methanocella sp. CWC-04]
MDEIDVKMLKELWSNSRIPYRDLADKMELSVNSIHKRVQSMIDMGVIKRFIAYPSSKALPSVMIGIAGWSDAPDIEEAARVIGNDPCTQRLGLCSGNFMLIVGLLQDISEMSRYITFVTNEGKLTGMNVAITGLNEIQKTVDNALTNLDYRILAALQYDSRKQIVDIAEELGVSAKTIRRRLDRMEENGLIHYSVYVDVESSGYIHATFEVKTKTGADVTGLFNKLRKEYEHYFIVIWPFYTTPDLFNISIISRSLSEQNAFLNRLKNEGVFEKVTSHMIYKYTFYDTWREELIKKRASE